MRNKILILSLSLLLNNSLYAEWLPGQIPSSSPKSSHMESAKPTQVGDENLKVDQKTEWVKALPMAPKKKNVDPYQLQQLPYLGRIEGVDYKNVEKTQISGFKVKIINVAHGGDISLLNKEVYLPYVVIIKKELVSVLSVRNSGGTELTNLALDPNQLIEFESITTVEHPTKTWGEMQLIPKRPLVSKVTQL